MISSMMKQSGETSLSERQCLKQTKKPGKHGRSTQMYKWKYNKEIELEEYIEKVYNKVSSACTTMRECDGDMWLSDYNKLMDAEYRLSDLLNQMKKEPE